MTRFAICIFITIAINCIGIVLISAQTPDTFKDRTSIDTCVQQLYRLLSYQNGDLTAIDGAPGVGY